MKNDKKKIIIIICVAAVLIVLAFFIGLSVSRGAKSFNKEAIGKTAGGFAGQGGRDGMMRTGQSGKQGSGMGGGISGEIISIDAQGFTVKLRDGGSAIVLTASSTKMEKRIEALKDEFKVGDTMNVVGQKNSDGSYTAQSIILSDNDQIKK